jgi:hypothetical protein
MGETRAWNEVQPRQLLLRQAEMPEADEDKEQEQSAVQARHDPTAQLSCRLGDASCAGAHAGAIQRSATPSAASVLRLQREYGNRFVQRVMGLARKGEGEAEVTPEVEQTIQGARGGGQAMDSNVRAQMEPAFGADFGGVRVHTGSQADSLNRSLSARAFTTGQDIFFKQGEYSPGSSSGRELLAHELTHVVQQGGDQVRTKLTLGQPGDRYEQEADSVARAVVQGEQEGAVQRQVEGEEDKESEPVQTKLRDGQVQRQDTEETDNEEPVQPMREESRQQQVLTAR